MPRTSRWFGVTAVVFASFVVAQVMTPCRLAAQTNYREAMDVPALLKQLDSPIDTVRGSAFYQLLWQPQQGPYDAATRTRALLFANPNRAVAIRAALRRALARENSEASLPGARPLTGLYKSYRADLQKSVDAIPK